MKKKKSIPGDQECNRLNEERLEECNQNHR
jgi:hypothetical protein